MGLRISLFFSLADIQGVWEGGDHREDDEPGGLQNQYFPDRRRVCGQARRPVSASRVFWEAGKKDRKKVQLILF